MSKLEDFENLPYETNPDYNNNFIDKSNNDKKYLFGGIDPSFKGLGTAIIDTIDKQLIFNELSVELNHGAFSEVCDACEEMIIKFSDNNSLFESEYMLFGMEIPPVQGLYAVKLWALDTHLYNNFCTNKPYLFNVPYLKFINKKYESKKDTINMINQIIDVFKDNDYEIIQCALTKTGKDKKLTSNECDAFIYAIRMFVKYHYDNGISNPMLAEIININDKFLEEKETIIGKKI